MRQPVQKRALRTRAALLDAAAAQFSEAGYAGTTAKSIAAAAGVATGSFYQYFPDKDAALHELARARTARLSERLHALQLPDGALRPDTHSTEVPDGHRTAVAAMIREVLRYHREDQGLHAVLTERRHADPELQAITAAAERSLVASIEAALTGWGVQGDRRALSFVMFSMIEGAVHAHVLGQQVVSDRRLLSSLSDAVLTLALAGTKPRASSRNGNGRR